MRNSHPILTVLSLFVLYLGSNFFHLFWYMCVVHNVYTTCGTLVHIYFLIPLVIPVPRLPHTPTHHLTLFLLFGHVSQRCCRPSLCRTPCVCIAHSNELSSSLILSLPPNSLPLLIPFPFEKHLLNTSE